MGLPGQLPPGAVKEVETLLDKLLNGPVKKLDDDFQRLLNKKKSPKPEPKTKTDPFIPVKKKTDEVVLNSEDGTRVLTLKDAMNAVVAVLNDDLESLVDRATIMQINATKITSVGDAFDQLHDVLESIMTMDQPTHTKITWIAKLMKLKLLSQKAPRKYKTKTGRFRT